MARFELKLPKMGESVAEATITNWLKEVGDPIEEDEAVLEIATDKVDSEVPSEVDGVLVEKLFEPDDVVQVGQTIAIIETEGEELLLVCFTQKVVSHLFCRSDLMLVRGFRLGINGGQALDPDALEIIRQLPALYHRSPPEFLYLISNTRRSDRQRFQRAGVSCSLRRIPRPFRCTIPSGPRPNPDAGRARYFSRSSRARTSPSVPALEIDGSCGHAKNSRERTSPRLGLRTQDRFCRAGPCGAF